MKRIINRAALAMIVSLAPIATAQDLYTKNFVETENAYYFQAPTATGTLPFYFPKMYIELVERDLGDDRPDLIRFDAYIHHSLPSDEEVARVQEKISDWSGKPINTRQAFIADNCTFNKRIEGQINASEPFPTRAGTWTNGWGKRFCRFGITAKNTPANVELLVKAAKDGTLLSSGITGYAIKHPGGESDLAIVPGEIHGRIKAGVEDVAAEYTDNAAMFLVGVAAAKSFRKFEVESIAKDHSAILDRLKELLFSAQQDKLLLKSELGPVDDINVKVIGTQTTVPKI